MTRQISAPEKRRSYGRFHGHILRAPTLSGRAQYVLGKRNGPHLMRWNGNTQGRTCGREAGNRQRSACDTHAVCQPLQAASLAGLGTSAAVVLNAKLQIVLRATYLDVH